MYFVYETEEVQTFYIYRHFIIENESVSSIHKIFSTESVFYRKYIDLI